jgi:hypothetical protein
MRVLRDRCMQYPEETIGSEKPRSHGVMRSGYFRQTML